MNDFGSLVHNARKKWALLNSGKLPVIYVGAASCGRAAGASQTVAAVRKTLKKNKLKATVVEVGCIGPCYLEPLMDITVSGYPRISYANVSPQDAEMIIESFLVNSNPLPERAFGHFGGNGHKITEHIPRFFDLPMMKPQVRVVLRNCGFIDPENLDHYLANDGYQGLKKALEMGWEKVIKEVELAGLRGRGGAGFPTYRKWTICRGYLEKTKYMICNVSEGDPGAFMNRSLIESDPHCVMEGLIIAAFAIGSSHGYIYINCAYHLAISRLKKAAERMRECGLLGKNILGSGFDFDITIKEGAGAFVCGEETALIRSIEGKRGMPRSRPPFPAEAGLFDKPTIINNVETLGVLPSIIRNGASWYRQYGVEGNYGTKTFSLVGKVRRPGLVEVPLGIKLRDIIFAIGGGSWKQYKGVQTGGPSGGCLSEESLDIPVQYESMTAAGSIMGSGGMIVMDEDTCPVDLALYFLHFVQSESCGKCSPCRVGTWHMVTILEKITKGQAKAEDISRLQTLAETVKRTSLCGLGQTAPNPVLTTLRYFRSEYLDHVQEKYCSAGVCKELVTYVIDAQKCNGCQQCANMCPTGAISGRRSELHQIDLNLCIKCRACYEVCRFHPLAGNAIEIRSERGVS
ncbi:MAG TPA: NADH-ubiquinone oxidoreductase-F iron-sulfur binding region domain-containing protein [Acidobacteriota bacterium]|nr:NADH-ubiquinone oxidoreductase-F iron-sulfur binding region domain-containing protein [Acidobacteriota bacterium]